MKIKYLIFVFGVFASCSTSSKLYTIWTDGSTENATFLIEKDSIYFVDDLKKYKSIITNDSIIVFKEDILKYKYKIKNDTLYLKNILGNWKNWKFKD